MGLVHEYSISVRFDERRAMPFMPDACEEVAGPVLWTYEVGDAEWVLEDESVSIDEQFLENKAASD